MSDGKNKVHVLKTRQSQDNEFFAKALETTVERIRDHKDHITGFAITISFSDGSMATEFVGDDYGRLLAGAAVLQSRIANEFVKYDD